MLITVSCTRTHVVHSSAILLLGPHQRLTHPSRPTHSQNNFERGQKDEFEVSGSDVGQIQKIVIGHDNWGETKQDGQMNMILEVRWPE